MTELVSPFFWVYGDFISSTKTSIPILDLIPWKTSDSMGYDCVQSYELLILLETKLRAAQEDVDELVLEQSKDYLVLLCELNGDFDYLKGNDWYC